MHADLYRARVCESVCQLSTLARGAEMRVGRHLTHLSMSCQTVASDLWSTVKAKTRRDATSCSYRAWRDLDMDDGGEWRETPQE